MTQSAKMLMHVVLLTKLSLADFALIFHNLNRVLGFYVLVEIASIEVSVVALLAIVQVVLGVLVLVECRLIIANSITEITFKSHLKSIKSKLIN